MLFWSSINSSSKQGSIRNKTKTPMAYIINTCLIKLDKSNLKLSVLLSCAKACSSTFSPLQLCLLPGS